MYDKLYDSPLTQVLKLRAKRIAILGKPTVDEEKASSEIDKMISDLNRKTNG